MAWRGTSVAVGLWGTSQWSAHSRLADLVAVGQPPRELPAPPRTTVALALPTPPDHYRRLTRWPYLESDRSVRPSPCAANPPLPRHGIPSRARPQDARWHRRGAAVAQA